MEDSGKFIKNIEERIDAFGDFLEREIIGGFQQYSLTNSTSDQFELEPYYYYSNKKNGGEGSELINPNKTDSLYLDLKNVGTYLFEGKAKPCKSPISINGNHVVSLVKLSGMYSETIPKRLEDFRNATLSNDIFLLVEKIIGQDKCYGTLVAGNFSTKMRVSFSINSQNEVTIAPLKKWTK